jgi:hypothetical protein
MEIEHNSMRLVLASPWETPSNGVWDAKRAQFEAEADGIRVRGKAEADAIEARAKALAQNVNLVQLNVVEKWDGRLPTTQVPGAFVPFISIK